ncbi:MAG TPA: membrane protein insertase YidC [Saprospiraceae bacterium]|nr:membrane protein insertase YidC [Saprospiraceae bacterium]HNT21956.1 membrane protein insertase YidC [Saprospiraceae bacterium]
MDRNNIVGFILIFVVLLLWSYFSTRQHQQEAIQTRIQDSITRVQIIQDSLRNQIRASGTGTDTLAMAAPAGPQAGMAGVLVDSTAKASDYTLENEVLKLTLNSLGGQITKAELKEYKKMVVVSKGPDQKAPLYLLHHPSNLLNLTLPLRDRPLETKNLIFSVPGSDPSSVTFRAVTPDGKQLDLEYRLHPGSYLVDFKISLNGFDQDLAEKEIVLDWQNYIEPLERGIAYEKTLTSLHYKPLADDKERLKAGGAEKESFEGPVSWISNAQQFFNTSLLADEPFRNLTVETTPGPEGSEYLARFNSRVSIPFQVSGAQGLKWYIGPNEFGLLKAQGNGMEDIISFGASILGSINKWVIRPVFNFLSGFIGSKGIVILVLTFIVKLMLFPLSYKMLHSQAKMGALKPELNQLREKFKGDQQAMQMESMKLYREFGVNPLGGCLPMLLQMPIWLALYQFFPASIEFRQASFLWADDLSSYDVFAKLPVSIPFFGAHISLFTLIWVVSTLIFTYYSTKDQDFSMNPAMKYMQYIMPVFFLFFFNNSASGLTAYMAFSNVLNIGQTLGGKALLFPETKMKEELHAARHKPKKKGGFQERLETMMKEQQKKMDERQKQVKK